MTIKEKAKAYDEAIEKVKPLYERAKKDDSPIWATYEHIFPQLAESDDEKIRKSLIEVAREVAQKQFFINRGTTLEDALAWLEKQKYNRMQPIYDSKESFESALDKAWESYNESGARTVDGCEDNYVECSYAKGFREGYLFGLEKQKESVPIPDKFSGLKSIMLQYLQSAANRKDDAEIEMDTDLWGRKILDYVWKYDVRDFIDDFPYSEQKEQNSSALQDAFERSVKDYSLEEKRLASDYADSILPTSITYGESDEEYKLHKIMEAAFIAGQKEQKPAEWSEEEAHDETKQEWRNSIDIPDSIKTSRIVVLENIISYFKYERKATQEEIRISFIPCLENLLKDVKSTNDYAEWSDEDERILKGIIGLVDHNQHYGVSNEEMISWLKSLPERFNLRLKTYYPESYNKDVQKIINDSIFLIEHYASHGHDKNLRENVINGLKSLRPQPKQVWTEEDDRICHLIMANLSESARHAITLPMETVNDFNNWLRTLQCMPPVFTDWNDEDQTLLSDTLGCVTMVQELKKQRKLNNFHISCSYDELRSWVRSLKSRPRKQPNTVSIKDAEKFGNLEYERGVEDGIQSEKKRKWKPNEEQMDAFRGYIEDFQARAEAAVGGWKNFDVMIRLYEQLKKLM